MTETILILNAQEKITLMRCLSIFIEQARDSLLIADEVETQTAQGILDSVGGVETTPIESVLQTLTNKLREANYEDRGTQSPHEPKTSYERNERA